MTNPCCCHNKVLLSRFNITGLGVMLFGHTRIHTHTRTHPPCSFYTCFLVSFPFHLIRLPSLLFNASAWVVYSISAPCCSLRHCLPLCPPYFSHNFIFYPPPPSPAALSPPFPVLPVVSPLSLGWDFHPSFVSLCSLSSPRSSFLIYFSFPSVFLFQPRVHPCFLVLFLLHRPPVSLPPSFPHLFSSSVHLLHPPPLPHPPLASLLQSYNCGHDGP